MNSFNSSNYDSLHYEQNNGSDVEIEENIFYPKCKNIQTQTTNSIIDVDSPDI